MLLVFSVLSVLNLKVLMRW